MTYADTARHEHLLLRLPRSINRRAKRFTWMRPVHLGVCALLVAALQCHAADGFERLGDDAIREAISSAQLSMAVYDVDTKVVDGGWRRIDWRNDTDGFKAAVYERRLAGGRIERQVVFAGTEELGDWMTNLEQGGGWLFGLNRARIDPLSADPYRKALEYAKLFVAAKDKDPHMTLSFSGHSLGGALAQYCSLQLGVRATVFNSAALHQKVLDLADSMKSEGSSLIRQFHLDQDRIHDFTLAIPGARQFGRDYLVKTPADFAGGLAANPAAGHGLEALALSMDRELMRRRFPVNESAPTPQQRAIDAARTDEIISQRFAVPQDAAALWANNMSALATALQEMRTLSTFDITRRPGSNELMKRLFGVPREGLTDALEKVGMVHEVIQAIQQDREQFRGQSFVLVRSHTMEKFAELGLQKLLPRFYEVLSDYKYIPFQARASLSGVEHKVGGPTFGLVEAMHAASRYGQLGHADIDSITDGLDALVGASWATLGLAVSGGNLKVAEIYQQAGQATAQSLRFATAQLGLDKPLLRLLDADFRGQADVMIRIYRFAQERALLTGGKIQSPAEYFGNEADSVLKASGFSAQDRRRLEDAHTEFRSRTPFSPTTISAGSSQQPLPQAVQDMRIAARLAPGDGKVVVFGSGPLADVAYREAATKVGGDNVRREPATTSRLERSMIAAEFGAQTIINVSQERYREETNAGFRRRVEADPVVKRAAMVPPRQEMPTAADVQARVRPPTNETRLPQVGGVLLQGVAKSASSGAALTSGNFSLIFKGEAGEISVPTLRRFVTAAWATYFTSHGPGISIDPLPGLKDRHVVRYIGRVVNSDLGRVMREADYIMKQWAVGDRRAVLDDFLNPDQFAARNRVAHVGVASRFWFVTEAMEYLTAGDALLFDDARLALKTQYLHRGDGASSPENESFAKQFTERYDEVARRYPVFDELREYAKMVALAKHLKESGVPMLAWLLANREMVLTEDSPGTVAAFARRSDYFANVHIEGGVDLSTTAQVSTFVPDAALLRALAGARAQAPVGGQRFFNVAPTSLGRAEPEQQELTVTPSQRLSMSGPQSSGDRFSTDLGLRVDGAPQLEIARFRRAGSGHTGEFGAGWQMLIPYSVRPASNERTRYSNALVPKAMTLRNELTGREETMSFDAEKYGVAGYVPAPSMSSLNIGLFVMSDGSLRLADKLGCEFHFDPAGHLTEMKLAPDYRVRYEYGEQRLNWRSFAALPYRLAPEGTERVEAAGARLPKTMRMHDVLLGRGQLFQFDPNDALGRVGYKSTGTATGSEQFLALRTDGSFVLDQGSGSSIAFDPAGRFTHATTVTLKGMTQGDYEVRFEHHLGNHGYRLTGARVVDRKKGEGVYKVTYRYDPQGELDVVSPVVAERTN